MLPFSVESLLVDTANAPIGVPANPLAVSAVSQNDPLATAPAVGHAAAFGGFSVVPDTVLLHLQYPNALLNTRLVTTTLGNGGAASASGGVATASTSTASNGSAVIQSRVAVKYTPGQGIKARFTGVFSSGKVNSQQEIGMGNLTEGFFFGYVGTTFGIIHRRSGSDTFVAQSGFNGTVPSGFDPTLGTPYMIQYQYLGFGAVRFFIENQATGFFDLVHTIRYASTTTSPSLAQATLPFWMRVVNSGNASNLTLSSGSIGVVTEGEINRFGLLGSVRNRKTSVTSLVPIVSVRNDTTFNAITNVGRVLLTGIAGSVGGNNADGQFVLVITPTLTNASFSAYSSTTSYVSVDTAATALSGGFEIYSFVIDNSGSIIVPNVQDLAIYLEPGDIVTLAAANISGGGIAPQAALMWREEV